MTNVPRSWPIEDYLDIDAQNIYKSGLRTYKGDPTEMARVMDYIHRNARDHARTPVQWNNSQYAGFSSVKPWMRVNDNYVDINVEQQRKDPSSVLAFWRKMIHLRKEYRDLFVYGYIEPHDMGNLATFTYTKEYQGRRALVTLNFSPDPQPVYKPECASNLKLLVSSCGEVEPQPDMLEPWEGRVYLVNT